MTSKLLRAFAVALPLIVSSACNVERKSLAIDGDILKMPAYVKFEYGAYNLATDSPYNTVNLSVKVYNVDKQEIDANIDYEATNLGAMSIDSNGVLTAKSSVSGSIIWASTTIDGVTRRDSAFVNIVSGPPPDFVKKLALEVLPGDSAKMGFSNALARGKNIPIVREGINTANLSNLKVALYSSDPTKITITQASQAATNANIRVIAGAPASVVYLHINAFAYGQGFRDSLMYTVGNMVSGYVSIVGRIDARGNSVLEFQPKRIVVGLGACIAWYKHDPASWLADVIFEDSNNVSNPSGVRECNLNYQMYDANPGNIALWTVDTVTTDDLQRVASRMRSRVFTKPGVFRFRTSQYGASGEVYVCDEVNDNTCRPGN